MSMDRDSWAFRILCWLALWGFGMASGGLLLFGVFALAQEPVGVGPKLAIVAGSVGTILWIVLSRLSTRVSLE